jgi:hypothetical protein
MTDSGCTTIPLYLPHADETALGRLVGFLRQ